MGRKKIPITSILSVNMKCDIFYLRKSGTFLTQWAGAFVEKLIELIQWNCRRIMMFTPYATPLIGQWALWVAWAATDGSKADTSFISSVSKPHVLCVARISYMGPPLIDLKSCAGDVAGPAITHCYLLVNIALYYPDRINIWRGSYIWLDINKRCRILLDR